ncbi:exported hypothetical protein [Candidatus Zixiibacteriota bacterium]|nr:exported hypothetical protein [candidate division Zixibacteria bacterium]
MIRQILSLLVLSIIAVLLFISGCGKDNPAKPQTPETVNRWLLRSNWTYSSFPAVIDTTHKRGYLIWYNPYNLIPTDSIWEDSQDQTQSKTRALWLNFTPSKVDRRLGEVAPEFEISDPTISWGGIMCYLEDDEIATIMIAEELELRIKGDQGIVHLDFGYLSEDMNRNIFDDEEDILRGGYRNHIYDPGEDIGLDMFPDTNEPGYDPVLNPDPNGDDWSYDNVDDYSHINGTEGNLMDANGNVRPDGEDLNNSGMIERINNYLSYKIDLSRSDPDSPFLLPGENFNGWRTFLIPLGDYRAIDTTYADQDRIWWRPRYARIWIESPDGDAVTVGFAEFNFVRY